MTFTVKGKREKKYQMQHQQFPLCKKCQMLTYDNHWPILQKLISNLPTNTKAAICSWRPPDDSIFHVSSPFQTFPQNARSQFQMESWFKFGALAWSQTWVPQKAVSVITSTSICLALSKYTIIIIIQTKWKTCWFLLVDDLQNTCMNFKPGLTWQNKHELKQLMQQDKPFAHWYLFLEQNVQISMLLTNQNLVSKKCQISNIRRLQGCHYISPTSEQIEECGLQQMLTIICFWSTSFSKLFGRGIWSKAKKVHFMYKWCQVAVN